jgi:hypothetical protein
VGSGPLASKVGGGGSHLGDTAPVRAERMTVWWRRVEAEALQPALVALEVPTISEGEGKGEARFNQNSKPRGGGAHRGGENQRRRRPKKRQRHDHWRGPEAEREGVLVVHFKGRMEAGKMGRGGVGRCPF